jgi:hypothetical protein
MWAREEAREWEKGAAGDSAEIPHYTGEILCHTRMPASEAEEEASQASEAEEEEREWEVFQTCSGLTGKEVEEQEEQAEEEEREWGVVVGYTFLKLLFVVIAYIVNELGH